MPGHDRPLDSDWLPVRDFLHGPEHERSFERPEIRLQSEPVVARVINQVLREGSRYGLLDGFIGAGATSHRESTLVTEERTTVANIACTRTAVQ